MGDRSLSDVQRAPLSAPAPISPLHNLAAFDCGAQRLGRDSQSRRGVVGVRCLLCRIIGGESLHRAFQRSDALRQRLHIRLLDAFLLGARKDGTMYALQKKYFDITYEHMPEVPTASV